MGNRGRHSGDDAMDEMAAALGPEAARTVARLLGGTTVRPPRQITPDHYLVQKLGAELAGELVRWLNGDRFYVPMQSERRRRCLDLLEAKQMTITQIALELGLTERAVYKIKAGAAPKPLPPRDDRQMDLFA